ncbi:MarR family winged helix-turn-helix transcriptional regulator [Amycolatopsis sp. NPDC051903]|uniref:MarR family winged helix-turn-helix transcriptional regulator n=1 Tax=Amycolatopsis sp. NPDC051903 TaxID=3363936 RepID=UPI00379CB0E4
MEPTLAACELADRLAETGDTLDVLELATAVLVRNFELLRRRTDTYAELDQSEYLALRTLDELGSADIGTLAGALGLDPSTVGRQASVMLGKGLVERSPSAADRRRSILTPTEEGRHRMRLTQSRRRRTAAGLLSDWSEDELRSFGTLLTRYNKAVATKYLTPDA